MQHTIGATLSSNRYGRTISLSARLTSNRWRIRSDCFEPDGAQRQNPGPRISFILTRAASRPETSFRSAPAVMISSRPGRELRPLEAVGQVSGFKTVCAGKDPTRKQCFIAYRHQTSAPTPRLALSTHWRPTGRQFNWNIGQR